MKQESIIIRILQPDEGMVLTNGQTFSTMVYLGTADDPSNWHEITQEQYERIKESEAEENE